MDYKLKWYKDDNTQLKKRQPVLVTTDHVMVLGGPSDPWRGIQDGNGAQTHQSYLFLLCLLFNNLLDNCLCSSPCLTLAVTEFVNFDQSGIY